MGYDIHAYLAKDPNENHEPVFGRMDEFYEVITLQRGSRNTVIKELFKALHAEQWDGEVSGNAGNQWFSRDEIINAIQILTLTLRETPVLASELVFLNTILEWMTRDPDKPYERVFIWFC